MRLHVVAVGAKLPDWAEAACSAYGARMPRGYATRRVAVRPEPRERGRTPAQMRAAEARRIEAALPTGALRIGLDERGRDLDTAQFAKALRGWLDRGVPLAFLVGGPDGLDDALKKDCAALVRLSSLTLPHALAQVVLAEQLYRAASLHGGHPYHRD
ncbi:MAG TPA: 23S rRNA (pseudouridine(1915)-N(3))-methyltransferase RlmH [Burkholderiales bacterium]